MNAVDVVILAIVGLAALSGFRRGFVLEVAGLFGAFAALAIARLEYADVRSTLARFLHQSPWLTVVSYLVVFLVVWGAIIIIARKVRSLVRLMMLGWLDRLGGVMIGVVQGLVVVELLLYFARLVPNGGLRHLAHHAALAPALLSVMPLLKHAVPHVPS